MGGVWFGLLGIGAVWPPLSCGGASFLTLSSWVLHLLPTPSSWRGLLFLTKETNLVYEIIFSQLLKTNKNDYNDHWWIAFFSHSGGKRVSKCVRE